MGKLDGRAALGKLPGARVRPWPPGKGIETLLEAMPALLGEHPDTQLAIAGSGVEEASLKAQASAFVSSIQNGVSHTSYSRAGATTSTESWDKDQDSVDKNNDLINKVNGNLAHYETIKKVVVVPEEWTVESGELTPSMKLKRRVINEKYKEQIDALYAEK